MGKQKGNLQFKITVEICDEDGNVVNKATTTDSMNCKPTVFNTPEEFRPYLDKTENIIIKSEKMMQDTMLDAVTKSLAQDNSNNKKKNKSSIY